MIFEPDDVMNNDPAEPTEHMELGPGVAVMRGRFVISASMLAEPPGAAFLANDAMNSNVVMVRYLLTRGRAPDDAIAEARIAMRRAASSPHPHIVRAYDVDWHDDGVLVVTEPHGTSLRCTLAERRLSLDEALTIGRHICGALSYLHTHGVIHGVLTPATVDLSESQTARLSDIGILSIADFLVDPFPGDLFERAGYLAPEEQRGHEPTAATDIYHFGALLWEMTLGSPPPTREPLVILATKKELSHDLSDIIAQCLQPLPEHRPHDASSLSHRLRLMQRSLRGEPSGNIMAKIQISRQQTEHLEDTYPRLEALWAEREEGIVEEPAPMAEDNTTITTEPHPIFSALRRWGPKPPAISDSQPAPTIKRGELTPAQRRSAEALIAVPPDKAVRRQIVDISAIGPFFARRRPLALAAIVAIIATVAVVYGTGVYLSSAAPPPPNDIRLQPTVTMLAPRATPYHVTHTITLVAGQTLHIEAGTVLAFAPDTALIIRGGELDAEGTTQAPILFTSTGDPAIGGNGAHAGIWNGIILQTGTPGGSGHATLANTTLRFAGAQNSAAISCQTGALTMTDSLQSDSAGAGLVGASGCWGEVARTTFERNAGDAADVTTPALHFHDNVVLGSAVNLP